MQPTHGPSLSRSSSRKAEQSPYRRNPMAELDENALGNNHHHNNGSNGKLQKVRIGESFKLFFILALNVPHQLG